MFFSHFDPDTNEAMLVSAGLDVEDRRVESQLDADREVEYVWFVASRNRE